MVQIIVDIDDIAILESLTSRTTYWQVIGSRLDEHYLFVGVSSLFAVIKKGS